jgi:hypothetical protein
MRGGIALLRVKICEVYLGGKCGSKSAVEVGDGARYWRAFGRFGSD